MKSVPRLERELTDEIIALRQEINVLRSELEDMNKKLLNLARRMTDEELYEQMKGF